MSARLQSIFGRVWGQVREIPDVKVNLVRLNDLGQYFGAVLPGWALPLGMPPCKVLHACCAPSYVLCVV